jgi:hypothetical protein
MIDQFIANIQKLEDCAEVRWRKYTNRTVKKIQTMVKPEKELEAFDDRPSAQRE